MNTIKQTKIKLGRTVNIGDFENYKPELEITFDGEVIYAEAFKLVKEEIDMEADRLRTNVKNSQNVPPPVPKAQNDLPDTQPCPKHKRTDGQQVQMKKRMGSKGPFYSHARKLLDSWDYCSGKGWKSELDEEASELAGAEVDSSWNQ